MRLFRPNSGLFLVQLVVTGKHYKPKSRDKTVDANKGTISPHRVGEINVNK